MRNFLLSLLFLFVADSHFFNLPKRIGDWKLSNTLRYYTKDTLYEYLNGGADFYLSYNVEQVLVATYRKDAKEIVVEIFKTPSSEDSFGLFHRDIKQYIEIGQGATYGDGMLRFWKGSFYLKLYSTYHVNKNDLIKMSSVISSQISEKGEIPFLVKILPLEGLKKNTIRYFHSAWAIPDLQDRFLLKSLHLNNQTQAIIADYEIDSLRLFIVRYPKRFTVKQILNNLSSLDLEIKQFQNFILIAKGKDKKQRDNFLNRVIANLKKYNRQ